VWLLEVIGCFAAPDVLQIAWTVPAFVEEEIRIAAFIPFDLLYRGVCGELIDAAGDCHLVFHFGETFVAAAKLVVWSGVVNSLWVHGGRWLARLVRTRQQEENGVTVAAWFAIGDKFPLVSCVFQSSQNWLSCFHYRNTLAAYSAVCY
jgi:hypothetical protein